MITDHGKQRMGFALAGYPVNHQSVPLNSGLSLASKLMREQSIVQNVGRQPCRLGIILKNRDPEFGFRCREIGRWFRRFEDRSRGIRRRLPADDFKRCPAFASRCHIKNAAYQV